MIPSKKNYANTYSKGTMRSFKDQAEDKKKYKKLKKEKRESRETNIASRHPDASLLTVRGATEALIGKGNLAEKFIAFGEKFDKKQAAKSKLKKNTKEMKKRAKKLDEYKNYK